MNSEKLGYLVEKCLNELSSAKEGKFESDRAERAAALFLETQMHALDLLQDLELKARMSKHEIEKTEAEKYFSIKTANISGAKLTEVALGHAIVKDESVIESKVKSASLEVEVKKWQFMLNTLKEGHVFFRGLGKKAWE